MFVVNWSYFMTWLRINLLDIIHHLLVPIHSLGSSLLYLGGDKDVPTIV